MGPSELGHLSKTILQCFIIQHYYITNRITSIRAISVVTVLVPEEKSPLKGPKRDHFFSKKGTKKGPKISKKGTFPDNVFANMNLFGPD